jgi:hypothetical protein
LLWNESWSTDGRASSCGQDIERKQRKATSTRWPWFQADEGFFYINFFDASRNVLHGITLLSSTRRSASSA